MDDKKGEERTIGEIKGRIFETRIQMMKSCLEELFLFDIVTLEQATDLMTKYHKKKEQEMYSGIPALHNIK